MPFANIDSSRLNDSTRSCLRANLSKNIPSENNKYNRQRWLGGTVQHATFSEPKGHHREAKKKNKHRKFPIGRHFMVCFRKMLMQIGTGLKRKKTCTAIKESRRIRLPGFPSDQKNLYKENS